MAVTRPSDSKNSRISIRLSYCIYLRILRISYSHWMSVRTLVDLSDVGALRVLGVLDS
jgi:hypothetical protein